MQESGAREEIKEESLLPAPGPEQKLPPGSSAEKKEGIEGTAQRLREIADTPGMPAEAADELRRLAELMAEQWRTERDKVVKETAGAAAHEINNPLTVISATLEILDLNLPADFAKRDLLKKSRESVERITDIVKNMQAATHYATEPYVAGTDIIDFNSAK